MDFGTNLKKLRKDRSLSQDELAALLGTTKQVISRYENGRRIPRLSVVSEYARRLGIPLSSLSGEEDTTEAVGGGRRVPILGSAACGEPIYRPSDGTEYVVVDEDVPCDFALIAQGDSMTGDRIYSGDIVFIRQQETVADGEIAAVALDNELTLKHAVSYTH